MGKGGTDDHKGKQVYITESHGTGAAAAGDESWVTSFDATNKDATIAPTLTGTGTKTGKGYELWDRYTVEQVNDKINEAIRHATDDILVDKSDESLGKITGIYRYAGQRERNNWTLPVSPLFPKPSHHSQAFPPGTCLP